MIQLLKIPPLVPQSVTDAVAGPIDYVVPASNVISSHGTLATVGLIVPVGGTLVAQNTVIDPYAIFDWSQYAERDAQLIGRDHIVTSATVRVASSASMVFSSRVERPLELTLAPSALADAGQDRSVLASPEGTVMMVQPSSVPYDGVRADQDLYGRDLLLHETLARVASVFVAPPVESVDTLGAVDTISDAWSLAEGSPSNVGINPALRLDVNLFKSPDRTLAFTDNSLGVYIANIANFLANPFLSAGQLVIETTSTEAEVYTHDPSQDTASIRVWVAEPKLDGRFKIVYYIDTGLLRWYPSDSGEIHIPRPQPFVLGGTTIPGIGAETIDFVVGSLQRQDSAYYAWKASQVVLKEASKTTRLLVSGAYSAGIDQGNLIQDVQITQSGAVLLESIPALAAGDYTVGLTIVPRSFFEIYGCQFPQLTPDDNGGLFPSLGATAVFDVSILPGNYQLEISYTNYGGDTPADFSVLISFNGAVITSSPMAFGSEGLIDGDVATKVFNLVSDGVASDLSISCAGTATTSQFKITRIRIKSSDTTPLSVNLNASLYSGASLVASSACEFNGLRDRPDVALFKFTCGSIAEPSIRVSLINNTNLTALAINQVQVAQAATLTVTPNAAGAGNYPSALLHRAMGSVTDSFRSIDNYTDPRQANGDVYEWTLASTASWLSQLMTVEPRLGQAFRLAGPLDVGRPGLVPSGLEYVRATGHVSTLPIGSIWAGSEDTEPQLRSITAWMLLAQFPVAVDGFSGLGV